MIATFDAVSHSLSRGTDSKIVTLRLDSAYLPVFKIDVGDAFKGAERFRFKGDIKVRVLIAGMKEGDALYAKAGRNIMSDSNGRRVWRKTIVCVRDVD